ncbi:MAG: AAA family ATPase [Chloroflexi bacterium]|nr:AAA family ATPase [Chloroflexota bacterium]
MLLNLKNHRERRLQQRYLDITEAFGSFFPRFDLDAVEANPGDGKPEIQVHEEGHERPLSLQTLSSGVTQILTLVTNLVGSDGLIIFIEHPELHLHPHAIRSVESLIRKSSGVNQIVVITHDPRFVDPESPRALRRVWLTSDGTKVLAPPKDLSAAQAGQYRTALRDIGGRELVFARCVVLVEDESQQNFMLGVAPVLGRDLDAAGISVVKVDGEDGYQRYFPLLNALGIPHVALKDKRWGNKKTYPPGRFFSFGMELEDYQDGHGLAAKREAQRARLGHGSKERVQRPLAESLARDEVPEVFKELLQAAFRLATGEPSN